jgi:hypothetical protein
VKTKSRWQSPACSRHARNLLLCLAVALLLASPANAGLLGGSSYSYYSWQWGGFSRSGPLPAVTPSVSLALASSRSSTGRTLNLAAAAGSEASLSGVVYYDEDQDNVRESTDWGIRDAIVVLTGLNTGTKLTAVTTNDGVYSFSGLPADDYTISLSTPGNQPEQPSPGSIFDASNHYVSTGRGTASGLTAIAAIHLETGYTATDYDFPQATYPMSLVSKRMLVGSNPGLRNPPPVVLVPEPDVLALLVAMILSVAWLLRRAHS